MEPTPHSPQQPKDPASHGQMLAERRRLDLWLNEQIKRGQKEKHYVDVEVTPLLADILLSRNLQNRTLRDSDIIKYAIDMKNGDWQLNGESIKLSREGLLNDGQHRLSSVRRANVPVMMTLCFGVERDSRLSLDQGSARSSGDYLSMDGVDNANCAASVASLYWQFKVRHEIASGQSGRPTRTQVSATFHDNPEITDSIKSIPTKCSQLGSKAMFAFCHYVFKQHDAEKTEEFFGKLIGGANLTERDPIFVLRDRLLKGRLMRERGKQLMMDAKIELIFRAFLAHCQGRKLATLQLQGHLPKEIK